MISKIILLAVSTFFYSLGFCQLEVKADSVKIRIEDAANHYGEKVTICSKVYGIKTVEKSQTTFINLGALKSIYLPKIQTFWQHIYHRGIRTLSSYLKQSYLQWN